MSQASTKGRPRLGQNLKESLRPIEKASHAPGYVYSDPAVLDIEKDRLFMRDWLFVGRLEELKQPGDFLTWRIAGEPIVVTRDQDGDLQAFYNMCAHRGVEVAQGQGNARTFKCPYHGWVYDLSGKLMGAAYMERVEGFDPSTCRLPALALDTWAGNIFVSFNSDPPPLTEFMGGFDSDFADLRLQDCRLGNKIELELDCNWKFISENLMDFYHVGVLHSNSFGARFSWKKEDVHLKEKGGLHIRYKAGPPTPKAEPLIGKMPWLEDQPYNYACTGFLAPNLTLFGRIDCVRLFTAWPETVDHCKVIIYHLFPEEFFERPDFDEKLKIYHDYQVLVIEEDRSMMESLQRAMASRGFVPGRMSTLETPIHNYLKGHFNRTFAPEDGTSGGRGK